MRDLRKAAEKECEVPLHEQLESVPENARLVIDSEDGLSTRYIPVWILCQQAAQALRQALAQPEQEPFGYFRYDLEWDGWVETNHDDGKPLYTAPPKREWVGLTDEEITKSLEQAKLPSIFSYRMAGKAIEAKLKEKNT